MLMLSSDELTIPYERLADWAALVVAAVAYVGWSAASLFGFRLFVHRTRMRVLGTTIAALVLIAGLAVYALVFLSAHRVAFQAAVNAVFPEPLDAGSRTLLLALVSERGRSFITTPWITGLRGIAFYALPFIDFAAVLLARRWKLVPALPVRLRPSC